MRYFAEVADTGSFTRAAERLHVAQPAVSMAVRKLEEELELTLLSRRDRKVSLTAEGEVFLGHVRRTLAGIEAASQEMGEMRGLARGEVRVGIPPMMSAYYFPDLLCEFARRYPALRLSVSGEGASSIRKMILAGEIDMGVVAGPAHGEHAEELETRPLVREEVVAVVPPGHPFARKRSVRFDDFFREPLVFYKEGYYLRELLSGLRREKGGALRIVAETNLYTLVRSLVRRGLGISAILRMAVADAPGLVAVPFDPPLHLDLEIAWKRSGWLSRANRAFLDFLAERLRGYGTEGAAPVPGGGAAPRRGAGKGPSRGARLRKP